MREMLEEKLARFEELEGMMIDPEVLGNSNKLAAVAREHGGLAKRVNLYRSFKKTIEELTLCDIPRHYSPDPRLAQFYHVGHNYSSFLEIRS